MMVKCLTDMCAYAEVLYAGNNQLSTLPDLRFIRVCRIRYLLHAIQCVV